MSEERVMQYRKVSFKAGEILPDAPAGEWTATIPRGKVKVRPTKAKDNDPDSGGFPMLIVPFKLETAADERNEAYVGAEVSTMIVFFPDDNGRYARAAKMSKLRLTALLTACEVDLDVVPDEINGPADLDNLIGAIENKTLSIWTKHQTRQDTGETTVEVVFAPPGGALLSRNNEDEETVVGNGKRRRR